MATIYPFEPYRYTSAAGDLGKLVTQPYDKISPAMRERYLAGSPYNLVRVILGETFPSDTASNNVYTRAAGYLDAWIAQDILAKDDAPSLYVYFQEFTLPDSDEKLTRKGFIGLGKLEEYSAGIVHRHEQTLSGPKKDRTELLKHTRCHFGQIFMLYPDPERSVDRILDEESRRAPDVTVADEYAVHTLWRISDPARLSEIQRLMLDKKLLIADGHHRYETALGYRNEHPEVGDAKAVMMTFVNMYSEGLRILGTHRVVNSLPDFSIADLLDKAGTGFRIHRLATVAELRNVMDEIVPGTVRIGVVAQGSDTLYVLERGRMPAELDVRILHGHILKDLLGISDEAVREEKYLKYVRGVEPAVKEVRESGAQVAFLLQPTPIEDVGELSFGGGVMPQKSTDFYPKLLTGLALYRLEK